MIGMKLKGFCGGFFGRDSYGDKRIEAVGNDWIVAREENGEPVFATFVSGRHRDGLLAEWSEQGSKQDEQEG